MGMHDRCSRSPLRTKASDADYPAVARFGQSQEGAPLLGVKCLDGWCEIGFGAFTAQQPLTTTGSAPFELASILGPGSVVTRVKGWHDEQMLSVADAAGRFHPLVRAALVPFPGVADIAPDAFTDWTPLAVLYLADDPPAGKYYDWGLRKGPNVIWLREDGSTWNALMTNSAGSRPWVFLKREVHSDVVVPGTVRFRWTILDDGIWAPCGQACCQVEGEF